MSDPKRQLSHPNQIKNPIDHMRTGTCGQKCCYHWVRFMAVLDPIVWLSLLLAFKFVVQDTILSVPGEEWELTAHVRDTITGSKAYEEIGTVADLFDWLESDVIATLVPVTSDVPMRNAHAHFIRTTEGYEDTPVNTINGMLSLVEDKIFIRQVRTTSMSHGQKKGPRGQRVESKVCENAANCPDHFSHLYTEYATMPPQCQHVVDNKVDLSFVDSAISKNTDSVMSTGRGYSGSGFVEVIDAGLYATQVDGTTTKMKPPMAVHNTTIEPITNKTWGELNLKTSFAHYDAALKQSHQCALAKIRSIRDSGWLDELTRAIFIEYCVAPYWSIVPHRVNTKMSATRRWERGSDEFCEYNPSKNPQSPGSGKCHLKESVGACHRVVFEQNRYGRVTTTQTVMTARADSAPGDLAHKGLMLMIVCIVGLSLTVVIEFTEFLYSLTSEERRSAYLQPSSVFWNMMDLACICGLCMTLYNFPFAHQPFSPDSLEYMTHNDGQMGWQPVYTQFDVLDALEHTRYWFAITTLMWWMRGVEYFGVFPVLQLPIMALWYSISTVFSFLAFFAMLLVGASMCFRFLYGTASDAFADLNSSIMSMLLASIGEFRTEAIMVDYRKSDA
jgi:hypothetical protein